MSTRPISAPVGEPFARRRRSLRPVYPRRDVAQTNHSRGGSSPTATASAEVLQLAAKRDEGLITAFFGCWFSGCYLSRAQSRPVVLRCAERVSCRSAG